MFTLLLPKEYQSKFNFLGLFTGIYIKYIFSATKQPIVSKNINMFTHSSTWTN